MLYFDSWCFLSSIIRKGAKAWSSIFLSYPGVLGMANHLTKRDPLYRRAHLSEPMYAHIIYVVGWPSYKAAQTSGDTYLSLSLFLSLLSAKALAEGKPGRPMIQR